MPANGSVITGVGGASNITVSGGTVVIPPWQALYYVLPIGGSNASADANFRIASYTSAFQVPENWVLVALRNGDDNSLKLGTGVILKLGQTSSNGSAISKTDPIYIRGTGLNNAANATVTIGGTNQVNGTSRGLTLTIVTKSTHAVVSNTNYDTYGSSAASDNLATALNAITNGQIGILVSYDAWEGQITTNLQNAFKRLGLYKGLNTVIGGSRRPYAAIFEASSSSAIPSDHAVEVEYSSDGNEPYAEIRGWLIDGGFVASGGIPSGLATPIGANAVNVNESGNVGVGNNAP
jgi:hypothetical protein